MNQHETQNGKSVFGSNPFDVPLEAPMNKSTSCQVFHKLGDPEDWQGYGLVEAG